MFEFNWKKNKTVYLNLLGIKGISHTTAKKLCALLGISHNTLYTQLANHKLDLLNLLLNLYNKKTNVLTINSLVDLIEFSSPKNVNFSLLPSVISLLPHQKGSNSHLIGKEEKKGGILLLDHKIIPSEKQWVEKGNMNHNPIQNSLDTLKKENIISLIQLNTYRGRRFKFGYPVKGQRTRSNAKTAHKLNRIKYSSSL